MSVATVVSIGALVLQLGLGILLLGVGSAPGWRAARVFALISLSAAVYSGANVFLSAPWSNDALRQVATRVAFLAAAVHVAGWLIYVHGTSNDGRRELPRWAARMVQTVLGLGAFCAITGLHFDSQRFREVEVAWAGVVYRTPQPNTFGALVGASFVAALALVLGTFVKRHRRRERGSMAHIIGFAVFFACVAIELLVDNGVIEFLYLADVGFLAVVIPLSVETVRRFVEHAERLSDLSSRLAGEVEERTAERDRAQGALFEAESHAALGRLAAGVAHEINNPLTYVTLNIELVGEWVSRQQCPDDVRESIASALDGTERICKVVEALRAYTRAGTGKRIMLSPSVFVQSAIRVAGHQLRRSAEITTDFASTPTVLGEEPKMVQLMANVLTNAAQAIGESPRESAGAITVRTRTSEHGDALIEVTDDGPGMDNATLAQLTSPYFTTRTGSGAAGLGLFLSRGIVEQHGGTLAFESAVGRGTTVRITLPAAPVLIAEGPTPSKGTTEPPDVVSQLGVQHATTESAAQGVTESAARGAASTIA